MQRNRLHQLYSQSLSWSDQKLLRYLVLRKAPTDVQLLLALALALLSHRLPFYGEPSTVLEDPSGIAEYLVQSSKDASDSDKTATVSTLCLIANEYLDQGLELDTAPIQLLVRTGADICLLFEKQSLELRASMRDLESVVQQSLAKKDLEILTSMPIKSFMQRYDTEEKIVCTVMLGKPGSYSVMIVPGNFPAVLRTQTHLKFGEQVAATYVGTNDGRITLIPQLVEPSDAGARKLTGTVRESLGNDLFRIDLDDGKEILARISPTFRKNFQAARPGDRVYVKPAPPDCSY